MRLYEGIEKYATRFGFGDPAVRVFRLRLDVFRVTASRIFTWKNLEDNLTVTGPVRELIQFSVIYQRLGRFQKAKAETIRLQVTARIEICGARCRSG